MAPENVGQYSRFWGGLLFTCGTAKQGLLVRAVPHQGYSYISFCMHCMPIILVDY